MTRDATFDEGGEAPLYLGAMDEDDLKIVAALVQDAVFPASEMTWQPRRHRFAILLNRFRWEDQDAARRRGRDFERVRSLFVADNVLRVSSQGIDPKDKDTVLSLLDVEFQQSEDGGGHVMLTLAGDGAIRLEVEALEVTLKDVTRPYRAPSGEVPFHRI